MDLQLASGRLVVDACEEDVRRYVLDEEYAVLSADANTYMQCSGETGEDDFVLEYQAGGLDEHFCAVDERITGERVVQALIHYLRGDDAWRREFEWTKIDVS